jgi:hypothetical protein
MIIAFLSFKYCQRWSRDMIIKMTMQIRAPASEGTYRYIFQSNSGELGGLAIWNGVVQLEV